MNKNQWALLAQLEQDGIGSGFIPEDIQIDDSTNSPMVPKSMTVQVKRPLAYARPAQADETLQSLYDEYSDAQSRAREVNDTGTSEIQKQIADIRAQAMPDSFSGKLANVNIAPMLAYTDSLSGTNTLAGYERPPSMTERQKMILGLEDALQKRKGEAAKSDLEAIKEKLGLYIKSKEDPLKDLQTMARIQYMKDMGTLANSRFGRAENDTIERDVQKLADKVGNAQDLQTSIQSLEQGLGFKLDEFDEMRGTVKGKKIDLPGVAIPGVGRVVAHDKRARDLQSRFGRIFNVELKDRSGAAVTSPEMARLKEEFNAGRFNDEAELISAVKRYKAAAAQEFKNRQAAFRGVVQDRYRSRGGQLTDDFKAAPKRETKTWEGKTYELIGDDWVEVK